MDTKVIVFDFDGTLSKPRVGSSSWYEVWNYLDDLEYDDYLYNCFKRGDFSFEEWVKKIIVRYKSLGLLETDLLKISQKIELMDGISETFEYLKENKIKIFILSGGIKNIFMNVLKRQNLTDFIDEFVGYEFDFNNSGNLIDWHSDYGIIEPKSHVLNQLLNKYNFNPDQALYVGNDDNDEDVYSTGVRTLCINPHKADISNKTVWHQSMPVCKNLTEILNFL